MCVHVLINYVSVFVHVCIFYSLSIGLSDIYNNQECQTSGYVTDMASMILCFWCV